MKQNVRNVGNVGIGEMPLRNEIHMHTEYLAHHGTKGQKWGVRRYQNPDGTLTDAGKKRYGYGLDKGSSEYERKHAKAYNELRRKYDKIDKSAKKARASVRSSSNPTASQKHYADVLDTAAILEKKAMTKTLSQLKMGKSEIAYREAGYNYTKYIRGSVGGQLLANTIAGPAGNAAYVAARSMSPEGRRLGAEYKKASDKYHRH